MSLSNPKDGPKKGLKRFNAIELPPRMAQCRIGQQSAAARRRTDALPLLGDGGGGPLLSLGVGGTRSVLLSLGVGTRPVSQLVVLRVSQVRSLSYCDVKGVV